MMHSLFRAYPVITLLALVTSCGKERTAGKPDERTTRSHDREVSGKREVRGGNTLPVILSSAAKGRDNSDHYKREAAGLSAEELAGMIETLRNTSSKTTEEDRLHFFLLDEIARRDPLVAIELIKQGLNCNIFGVSENMFKQMLRSPSREDLLPAFDAVAAGVEKDERGVETASALAYGLASTDGAVDDFRSTLNLLFSGKNAPTMVSLYFGEANPQSPEARLAIVEGLDLAGREKAEAISAIAFASIRENPELSLSLLKRMEPQQAGSVYGKLFASWIAADPVKATANLEGLDAPQLQVALGSNSLLNALVSKSTPETITSLLEKIPLTASTSQAFSKLLGNLAERSPSDAMRIISDLPESPARDNLVQESMRKAEVRTASDAAAVLAGMDGSMRASAAHGLMIRLSSVDQGTALEFIRHVPKEQQSRLTAELVAQTIARAPDQAAELLLGEKEAIAAADASVAGNVSQAMANQNVENAREWSDRLPDHLKPDAYRGLVTVWRRTDAVAASKWLGTLPAGPARDAGARALIREIENTDTGTAEKWKATLQN